MAQQRPPTARHRHQPVILHLDVDAFFASVEQVLYPELRGQPVAVGSGVVASCSYEARRYGVRTGMPLAEAKRLCPHCIVRAGDYGQYLLFANRVEGICRDFTPVVEQSSLDDFYLDLTGCWLPGATAVAAAADPCRLAAALQQRIRSVTALSCSIGIGRNKLLARLASAAAKPARIVQLRPEQEADWLDRLPVDQLPGVGGKIGQELASYNIERVGQLAALPESVLMGLFGAHGRTLWQRAHGIDHRAVCDGAGTEEQEPGTAGRAGRQAKAPASIRRETTLERPTGEPAFLTAMLSYLTQRAAWEMRHRRLHTRCVAVQVRYADFQTDGTSRHLPEPASDDRVLVRQAQELFGRLYTRRLPLRHLAVELGRFTAADDDQRLLFDDAGRQQRRKLRRAVDRVRGRFGFQALVEGQATRLIEHLDQDRRGFRLRTPSLSR